MLFVRSGELYQQNVLILVASVIVFSCGVAVKTDFLCRAQVAQIIHLKIACRFNGEITGHNAQLKIGYLPCADGVGLVERVDLIAAKLPVVLPSIVELGCSAQHDAQLGAYGLHLIILAIVGYKLTGKYHLRDIAEQLSIDILRAAFFVLDNKVRIFQRICKVFIKCDFRYAVEILGLSGEHILPYADGLHIDRCVLCKGIFANKPGNRAVNIVRAAA